MDNIYYHKDPEECTVFGAHVMGKEGELHMALHIGHTGENGRRIPSRLNFWAAVPNKNSVERLMFVATGKMAFSLAKFLSAGKQFSCICHKHGEALVIRQIHYGPEATKTILEEVKSGVRPKHWAKPDHPDWYAWIGIIKARKDLKFDQQKHSKQFGYAKVFMPGECIPTIETEIRAAQTVH